MEGPPSSLPGSPRLQTARYRFLTPPVSPRERRLREPGGGRNLRKKLGYFESAISSSSLSPSSPKVSDSRCGESVLGDPLPFLDPTKKEWILSAAANDDSRLRDLLLQSPQLLPVADPYSGYTALHWAAKHDNVSLVCLLMDHALMMSQGTQLINWKSNGGYTPLHIAAINQASQAFSSLMMDYKADRKIRDFSGKTATSYLRTVLTTNLALSKIKEKYKGALIDLETRHHTEGKERFQIVRVEQ